ncbi:MAG TPA: response regulator [Thermoanaerobaculia bacterium]
MAVLQLELLGDLQMRSASGSLFNVSAKKSQALLAYLGVKPSQRVSREKIASLLWSSTGPDQARQSLRQTLSTLRKELVQLSPDEKILVEENDLLGVDEANVSCDVAAFESLVAAGSEESLAKASALYRGDFLDGFQINEERFDQWVIAERDRLHRMALRGNMQLMEIQTRRGAVDDAIATGQRSLRIDILQEPVHRSLMRLYMQSGDLLNAIQQFETLSKVLKRELRVDPDAETKALYRDIMQLREKASAQAAGSEERRQTVLIVEDNVLNRELMTALLKGAGYNAVVAKDGAEALMMIGKQRIDLLLLDVDLPYIDGHNLLAAVHDNGLEIPAIFISGLPGEEVELKAFQVGATDFIRKPVKNNVLLARVAKVLKGER